MTWRSDREYFAGKVAYIVGKGPSLDYVLPGHFEPQCPIICVNDSIKKVETLEITNPLYLIQQDWKLGKVPTKSKILTTEECRPIYGNKAIYFDRRDFELGMCPTMCLAIRLCESLSTASIVFVSFDSCTTGETEYAKCIGYSSSERSSPERFLSHKKAIEKVISIPYTFVTPTGITSPSYNP